MILSSLGELLNTQDGDDFLELLVLLQDCLDPNRGVVVILSDVGRVQDSRG